MAFELRPTSVATRTVILIAVFAAFSSSSASVSLDIVTPQTGGQTIGDFMLQNPPQNYTPEFVAPRSNCSGLIDNVDVSVLDASSWSCARSPVLVARRRRLPSRLPLYRSYSYSITHDDGHGNGYNISWPTQLCSQNVIGDVPSPDGQLVHNATLQSVYVSLSKLSSQDLYDYTITMLQNALDNFEIEMKAILCDPPTGTARGLLTTYLSSQVSGRWVLSITGLIGSFGITYGGLYVPIAHPGPTANFTSAENVAIIAAATALGGVYAFALNELHKKEVTNIFEAAILSLVVTAGEGMLALTKSVWDKVCTTSIIVIAETAELCLRCARGLTIFGDAENVPAGANLVPNDPLQGVQQPQQIQLANVCGGQ